MKNRLFLSFFCLSMFCLSEPSLGSTDTRELQSLLETVSVLQGNFVQTITTEDGRLLQTSTGKMSLKKPGQFRWEVLGDEPRLIIADGKKVWDYDKDLEQVTIQKLSKGQTAAPIFFLTGELNSLDTDFNINKIAIKNGQCLKNSDLCFELQPKRNEGSFQWIRIGFKTKTLNEMELLDQLGQVSQFRFKDLKLNGTIPASQFTFTPPKGIDVLTND